MAADEVVRKKFEKFVRKKYFLGGVEQGNGEKGLVQVKTERQMRGNLEDVGRKLMKLEPLYGAIGEISLEARGNNGLLLTSAKLSQLQKSLQLAQIDFKPPSSV